MSPSPAAYNAARARALRAVTALRYGVIVYDGVEYEAAVVIEGEGYDLTDSGQRTVSRLRCTIAKCLLDRPRIGAKVLHEDLAYEIETVGGDHVGDAGWTVVAFRTPGADV